MIRLMVSLWLWSMFAAANVYAGALPDTSDGGHFVPDIEDSDQWKEAPLEIPDYPSDQDLVEMGIAPEGTPFRYFIDRSSLVAGPDNVMRYVAVLESDSGARNVLFEGIHCSLANYKTYAFGASEGRMVAARNAEWKPIGWHDGVAGFRYNLMRYYLCKDGLPESVRQVVRLLRYGDQIGIDGNAASW
jgi:hypothetical protein